LLGLGSSSEGEGGRIPAALEDDLDYCLDILKINKYDDGETETKIKKLYAQNIAVFGIYHKRLVALKIIADFITLTSNILSLSQLYDFLMLSAAAAVSAEGMRGHKTLQEKNDIVFKIYRDIMENYQTTNDILKLNYPRIIIDVVAILNNGVDMSGKQVSLYRVYDYYLLRKSEPISSNNIAEVDVLSNIISGEDKDRTERERDISSNNDLIQHLIENVS
jgi:hypothetical protein